jgi:uncharacterized protein (DUF2249 family)
VLPLRRSVAQGGAMGSTTATAPRVVDIRQLGPCVERKACVLAAFDALGPGESLIVVNDHLPRGLRAHFDEQRPGRFEWRMIEEGPDTFRVQITHL